ncbi:MAG: HAMP domain-containing histidine kinase [Cytophagales bacterium]|nr:HAMP domain-containing histidine kinase [Cytophagales bacterium]
MGLSETYEKAGNAEKSLYYFDLYRTFADMIQWGEVDMLRTELKEEQLVSEIEKQKNKFTEEELEAKRKELTSLKDENEKFDLLIDDYDSLAAAQYSSLDQKELELELLKKAKELSEITLREETAQAESTNQTARLAKIFSFLIILSLSVLLVFIVFSYRRSKKQAAELLKSTTELVRTQEELIKSEKMAAIGMLAAGIAHEINNPLNFIYNGILALSNLVNKQTNGNAKQLKPFMDIINEGVSRCSKIISSLGHISRSGEKMDEDCDIHGILDNSMVIMSSLIPDNVKINKEYSKEKVFVKGNEGELHQAVMNIIANAFHAMDGKRGVLTLKTSIVHNQAIVEIRDTGVGIPPEFKHRLGDPFFTTKTPGKGTGLGLYITFSIISGHDGEVKKKTRNDTVYYGPDLDVSIRSVDALSGLENIHYKINDGSYAKYSDKLKFQEEGAFKLSYYGLDFVGNFTTPIEKSFIVDLKPPSTYHNINGLAIDNVISTSTKLYFTGEDSLSGVSKTYYKFDSNEFSAYTGKSLDISKLNEGEHTLNYYSIDFVQNKEEIKEFKFYYDKTAPIMAADILGDRFISNNQVYFSGRTKLKLTAVDNKVGVKQIMYSINNEPFRKYDRPFYLPSVSGEHLVRYYSEDNLSNISRSKIIGGSAEQFKHNVNKVYVDLTGPDIDYSYLGKHHRARDTVFINQGTKIVFNGVDPESGLGRFTYNLDGNSEELVYNDPFTISQEGYHLIGYFGYDKVNNRNIGSFFFYSDRKGPSIFANFSSEPYETKNKLNVYARDVNLYLATTDDKVGLANIYYQIDDRDFKEFVSKVKGFKRKTKYKVTIKAVDTLGNETISSVEFFTGK